MYAIFSLTLLKKGRILQNTHLYTIYIYITKCAVYNAETHISIFFGNGEDFSKFLWGLEERDYGLVLRKSEKYKCFFPSRENRIPNDELWFLRIFFFTDIRTVNHFPLYKLFKTAFNHLYCLKLVSTLISS